MLVEVCFLVNAIPYVAPCAANGRAYFQSRHFVDGAVVDVYWYGGYIAKRKYLVAVAANVECCTPFKIARVDVERING